MRRGVRAGAIFPLRTRCFEPQDLLLADRYFGGYFDLVLESGENAVVYHDDDAGTWFTQRA